MEKTVGKEMRAEPTEGKDPTVDSDAGSTAASATGSAEPSGVPAWYPRGKYLHDGEEVRQIVWSVTGSGGSVQISATVNYVDGTSRTMQSGGTYNNYGTFSKGASWPAVEAFGEGLARKLGFSCVQTSAGQEASGGYGGSYFEERWEANPPENAGRWEEVVYKGPGGDGVSRKRVE
jgi:hypothetical protein